MFCQQSKENPWILTEENSKLNKIEHASEALDCEVKNEEDLCKRHLLLLKNPPC